jgi:glycosyltransferase involved in cell wall biosynthesis
MGKPLKITVGICTRDNDDTIEETLVSILKQERKPDKIIVCDKSRDKTLDVIRGLSQNYGMPIQILHQKGDGVGDAYQQIYKNWGEETEIFATLQTNLVVESDWLKKIERGFNDNPDVGLISSYFPPGQEGTYFEHTGGKIGFFTGRNMAIRLEALRRVNGWDPNLSRGEDWDLNIRLWRAGIRSVGVKGIDHRWIKAETMNTLEKSIRQPTSLTFMAKYGLWYLKFDPVHVFGDLSCVLLLLLLASLPGTVFINLSYQSQLPLIVNAAAIILNTALYVASYALFYHMKITVSNLLRTLKHQVLNGLGFLSASYRLLFHKHRWNMAGFNR